MMVLIRVGVPNGVALPGADGDVLGLIVIKRRIWPYRRPEQACIRALRLDGDTNFCILDYHAPAGFGPPRHLHNVQDEVLEILEGSIAVWTPDWCGVSCCRR